MKKQPKIKPVKAWATRFRYEKDLRIRADAVYATQLALRDVWGVSANMVRVLITPIVRKPKRRKK